MKKSKYNYFVKGDNGADLVFNSMTCALAEIDETFTDIYNNIESIDKAELNEEKSELISQMLEANFIIEDSVDEKKLIEYRHYSGKYNTDVFGLTIAPTLKCNFACPYCYEDPSMGQMDDTIVEGIITSIENAAKRGKNIDITWYGGEPLMAMDLISSMSNKIIEICDENKRRYTSYMVSNGYLVTQENIDKMKKARIQGVQITLDGVPEIHNKRRKLKNRDEDTFFPILKSIQLLLKNDLRVNIRINVDKENMNGVGDLLDILKEHGLSDLPTGLGHVTPYTEVCQSIAESCLDTEEYAKLNNDFQVLLKDKGFVSHLYPYYPGIKANYCCADSIGAFVLDPKGNMYKCWNDVGNTVNSVGNILRIDNPSEVDFMKGLDYILWSPFKHEKCDDCKLLPICMGGCPYKGRGKDEPDCEKWKYNIEDVIKFTHSCNQDI